MKNFQQFVNIGICMSCNSPTIRALCSNCEGDLAERLGRIKVCVGRFSDHYAAWTLGNFFSLEAAE